MYFPNRSFHFANKEPSPVFTKAKVGSK